MSNGGLLKPEKGKSSLDPILNPTIPKSDHIDFESIFEVVKKAAIRFVPEVESNFKRKSTLAVEQVFETAKKSFALDETTEKSLLNFNTLFRETLDIKGLLDVTFEISKLANQYQPAFKADFETIRGLVSSSDNSAAIEHCVKVLEGVTNLDNLQICDIVST
ncbi:hypothetical protein MHBO_002137 [Bonamia ostreae]|uniref:Uncharacterized protein n=1 Tax=Bonamia ostreae TaxID=126728 RepID=A0ABV2ALI0_9EUKA